MHLELGGHVLLAAHNRLDIRFDRKACLPWYLNTMEFQAVTEQLSYMELGCLPGHFFYPAYCEMN